MSTYKPTPANEWRQPKRGDVVWRRHWIVLIPRLALPISYGLSWLLLYLGSYLSGASGRGISLCLLFIGIGISTIWLQYYVEDWKDEMYVLSPKERVLIHQMRHPFSLESGSRLRFEHIGFTQAQLGIKTEEGKNRPFSIGGFSRWLFGCGQVSVFGPSARIVQVLEDVFNPNQVKAIIDDIVEKSQ